MEFKKTVIKADRVVNGRGSSVDNDEFWQKTDLLQVITSNTGDIRPAVVNYSSIVESNEEAEFIAGVAAGFPEIFPDVLLNIAIRTHQMLVDLAAIKQNVRSSIDEDTAVKWMKLLLFRKNFNQESLLEFCLSVLRSPNDFLFPVACSLLLKLYKASPFQLDYTMLNTLLYDDSPDVVIPVLELFVMSDVTMIDPPVMRFILRSSNSKILEMGLYALSKITITKSDFILENRFAEDLIRLFITGSYSVKCNSAACICSLIINGAPSNLLVFLDKTEMFTEMLELDNDSLQMMVHRASSIIAEISDRLCPSL